MLNKARMSNNKPVNPRIFPDTANYVRGDWENTESTYI